MSTGKFPMRQIELFTLDALERSMTVRQCCLVFAALSVCLGLPALGAPTVLSFSDLHYSSSNCPLLSITILISLVPKDGLFSYGLKLNYDSAKARIAGTSDILVAPELDFNGTRGPGAQRLLGTNFAAVHGTVN